MFDERLASNTAEWTVSDLSGALKRTLEDTFEHVRVRGEMSGYRGPHSSGHVYFCLKDEGARLDAVIWKGTFQRLRPKLAGVMLEDGLEIVATGRISTFPGKSTYQIVVEAIEPAGVGALLAQIEKRRQKLAAEGLFAPERKRPLPYLPQVVGVVTSPTGAVIRDILHRLADRFPRHVLVWPARMQGETCAGEVAAAIRGFNALAADGPVPRPDVIIVARGGGSIEDLWGFNDEDLVRAAAASAIPLVAAVGHETDWTLIDHAADLRAPTPTAAAELVVPVRADLVAAVGDLARRHAEAAQRGVERLRGDLRATARALPGPEDLLGDKRQRLDLAAARLKPALGRNARAFELRLSGLGQLLERGSPRVRLSEMRGRLGLLQRKGDPAISFKNRVIILKDGLPEKRKRLYRAIVNLLSFRRQRLENAGKQLAAARTALLRMERVRLDQRRHRIGAVGEHLACALTAQLERRRARLTGLGQLIASLSYKSVLARGFALVRDGDGHPVHAAKAVAPGQSLALEFADGIVRATADGARPRRKAGAAERPEQRSLFET